MDFYLVQFHFTMKQNLIFEKSYFDEDWYTSIVDDMEILLPNRKISTYINALSDAGFIIEKMVEQTNEET